MRTDKRKDETHTHTWASQNSHPGWHFINSYKFWYNCELGFIGKWISLANPLWCKIEELGKCIERVGEIGMNGGGC